MIRYDQRASGLSQPQLCPEFGDSIDASRARITRETGPDIRKPWIRACIESLRAQGIEPDAYTTTTSALDLADLRRALGYTRWDLSGSSYGTRLALETMRTDPLGIRSVVLNGPRPPGPTNLLGEQLAFQRSLQRLFAACTADAACHTAFPDPETDLLTLYEELRREPLRVPAANGQDTVVLHEQRFIGGINNMLAGTGFTRQFLDIPTREPDASCIPRMPKVLFPTSWPGS
jgi:pimeloyl-ACP methyl ester carboxylesterase